MRQPKQTRQQSEDEDERGELKRFPMMHEALAAIGQAAGVLIGIGGLLLAGPVGLVAGPPFNTDDPEPVANQQWEWYVASQNFKTADGWSGTAPHFEVNYGAISNVQLHLIAPLAYSAPAHGAGHWGFGDLELGIKYRFVQETREGAESRAGFHSKSN